MNILELCNAIGLQPEIKSRVMAFAEDFDFASVEQQLKDFLIYGEMGAACAELETILGDDEDHIKILACMLQASADVYTIYKDKDISDEIYFATMKCYTRFIEETYEMTGRYHFDRYWWTIRQAGCHLFRIGELEYERKPLERKTVISIHIPSDADFSPPAVERSLEKAKVFFAEHAPELEGCEYCCHSWLLDRQLQGMLRRGSNIVSFQDRFEVLDDGEPTTEFIQWLFRTQSTEYGRLPENTSLQRNVKNHVLSGGVIRESYGRLK